jgi:molecular chaperone DnaJ
MSPKPDKTEANGEKEDNCTKKVAELEASLKEKTELEETYLTQLKYARAPGTQCGTILRLSGEGMNSRQGRGDELVHINVRVPEKLNPKERKLMEELAKEFEAEELYRCHWRR